MVNWSNYNVIFKLRIEALWVKIQTKKISKLDFDETNNFGKKNKLEIKNWK